MCSLSKKIPWKMMKIDGSRVPNLFLYFLNWSWDFTLRLRFSLKMKVLKFFFLFFRSLAPSFKSLKIVLEWKSVTKLISPNLSWKVSKLRIKQLNKSNKLAEIATVIINILKLVKVGEFQSPPLQTTQYILGGRILEIIPLVFS